jgi:aspartate-semialdehyde dehydrogenase
MVSKYRCAVLGATGLVGQRFVQLLDKHPWFEVTNLISSERSEGQKYGKICKWYCETPMPDWAMDMTLETTDIATFRKSNLDFVFSALPSNEAIKLEPMIAKDYPVFTKASAYRMEPDVPLIVPEVNPEQSKLIPIQRKRRGWKGFITTDPNCTTTQLVMALKPLMQYGLETVSVVTMQALSGAGLSGVASLEIIDNVIPYIKGEEEKVESETKKILGVMKNDRVQNAGFAISTSCNRVKVLDGHLECISVGLSKKPSVDAVKKAMTSYRGEPQRLKLPSAPERPIIVKEEENRPQPRLDRMLGKGMSIAVGRIRHDNVHSLKFLCLGHNTIRGAAGNGVLHAELFKAYGII